MNRNVLKVFALAVVFLAGLYLVKENRRGGSGFGASTPETTTETKAVAEPTFTERTTIPPNPYALPECLTLDTPCKRDRCHFGNALNRNSTLLCEQITDSRLRSLCLDRLGDAGKPGLSVIEGQVFNPVDCGVYANLQVEIRDENAGLTTAATETNSTGEYGAEVPTDGRYGVYVSIGGMTLNQNISVKGAGRHTVDFALS